MIQRRGWLPEAGNGYQLPTSKNTQTALETCMWLQGIGISQQTQTNMETDSPLAPPERNQSANILTLAW